MREKIIAGNWKMNLDVPASEKLAGELAAGEYSCRVIICPGYVSLYPVYGVIKNSQIRLGAQNMFYKDEGAYTGEVSASMIRSAGCEYVIIGHSERRKHFHESDEIINKKVKKAIESGLISILCIGETLEEREAGNHFDIVRDQLEKDLYEISEGNIPGVIIAYEPVWAIGTGKNAAPGQAEEMHSYIRKVIKDKYNEEVSSNIFILYGGSVNDKNSKEIFAMKNIDGGLIGGASLKADSFKKIIESI